MSIPMFPNRISNDKDGEEFHRALLKEVLEDGPGRFESRILALGRSELQYAYAALFGKYLSVLIELTKLQDATKSCSNPECPKGGRCNGECARNFESSTLDLEVAARDPRP